MCPALRQWTLVMHFLCPVGSTLLTPDPLVENLRSNASPHSVVAALLCCWSAAVAFVLASMLVAEAAVSRCAMAAEVVARTSERGRHRYGTGVAVGGT